MKVGSSWLVSFIDSTQRVMLTKPGRLPARNICMQYDYPFIRRIDAKTGIRMTDSYIVLPPATQKKLLEICKERWGSHE